jgi:hypothetical protein
MFAAFLLTRGDKTPVMDPGVTTQSRPRPVQPASAGVLPWHGAGRDLYPNFIREQCRRERTA